MITQDAVAAAVARSRAVAEVVIAPGALARSGEVFRHHFNTRSACLIADSAGWAAAGPAVEAALSAAGIMTRTHIIAANPRPKPTTELARAIAAVLSQDDATPVAIGSGVINDVVKHAAFALDRPYLCIGTAASMDGYTSAGAPLSDNGFKMTIQCRPARAVIGDLDVIADAPPEMTGWGYGDLAGKVPAGGDWIIADALGIEAIDDVAWPMVQDNLPAWLADPAAIAQGDRAATEGLFSGLTLVGLAMEAHGSSRPASGADHQIAHLWEMDDLAFDGERVSHGACVAVGCIAALRLYDWLLTQDLERLDIDAILARAPDMAAKQRAIASAFGSGEIGHKALAETAQKHITPEAHRARLLQVIRIWPTLRDRLDNHLLRAPEMAGRLATAGAPVEASDIGVDRERLCVTIVTARFLRSRYTILDLLDDIGMLEQAVAATLPAVSFQKTMP